jgi:hypothetical protein
MTQALQQEEKNQNSILQLKVAYEVVGECMLVTCSGPSDCHNCIEAIYKPIFSRLEDADCTGLVIDKRSIDCSRDKKSLDLVVETILRYKNRSILRKLAMVSSVEYNKDEKVLRDLLFSKGVNVRLFTDLDEAVSWAKAYP